MTAETVDFKIDKNAKASKLADMISKRIGMPTTDFIIKRQNVATSMQFKHLSLS